MAEVLDPLEAQSRSSLGQEGALAVCMLCGVPILSHPARGWLSQFRVLHIRDNKAYISGTGDRAIDDIVPLSPRRFRLDPEIGNEGANGLMLVSFGSIPLSRWKPALTPSDFNSTPVKAFAGHRACWNLLLHVHKSIEVDFLGLALLFQSIWHMDEYPDLDLDYGGLLRWGNKHIDEQFLSLTSKLSSLSGDYARFVDRDLTEVILTRNILYWSDPLAVPFIDDGANDSPQDPAETDNSQVRYRLYTSEGPPDCFEKWPHDILEILLCALPSPDVANLRLASRTFASTPLTVIFWASRFQPGLEFNCIRDCPRRHGRKRNWKVFYANAKAVVNDPYFRNRRRIWSVLLRLREFSFSVRHGGFFGEDIVTSKFGRVPLEKPGWRSHLAIFQPTKGYCNVFGWSPFASKRVTISKRVIRVGVTMVKLGQKQYIGGLRFESRDGTNVYIGWHNSASEKWLDLVHQTAIDNSEGHRIHGFQLAVDRQGVRGIAMVLNKDWVTTVVGDYSGIPRMRLVSSKMEGLTIKCDFDVKGFKILSISIRQDSTEKAKTLGRDETDLGPRIRGTSHNRDDFMWLPDVPDDRLFLAGFVAPTLDVRVSAPLTVCYFGGEDGKLLERLAKVSICLVNDFIWSIEFLYNRPVEGGGSTNTLTLGIPNWSSETLTSTPVQPQRYEFLINGQGGEFIAEMGAVIDNEGLAGIRVRLWTNALKQLFHSRAFIGTRQIDGLIHVHYFTHLGTDSYKSQALREFATAHRMLRHNEAPIDSNNWHICPNCMS